MNVSEREAIAEALQKARQANDWDGDHQFSDATASAVWKAAIREVEVNLQDAGLLTDSKNWHWRRVADATWANDSQVVAQTVNGRWIARTQDGARVGTTYECQRLAFEACGRASGQPVSHTWDIGTPVA